MHWEFPSGHWTAVGMAGFDGWCLCSLTINTLFLANSSAQSQSFADLVPCSLLALQGGYYCLSEDLMTKGRLVMA